MKFLVNKKLASRIGIITTGITIAGMLLLWIIVSTNTASMVKNDITNQMTDAVESRASIIDEYVTSAEEYVAAFALSREVRELLTDPEDPDLLARAQKYTEEFAGLKGIFEACTSPPRTPTCSPTPPRGPSASPPGRGTP